MNQETKTESYAKSQQLIEDQESSSFSRRNFVDIEKFLYSNFVTT